MTREDIIRMAREAGLPIFDVRAFPEDPAMQIYADIVTNHWHESAERFAQLVAAAEREACAKVCSDMHIEGDDNTGLAADAIRARGQQ